MTGEGRTLTASHALAWAMGSAWLALVYLTPPPPPTISLMRPEEIAPVEVQFEEPEPEPPPPQPTADTRPVEAPTPAAAPPPTIEKSAAREAAEAEDAFGGGANAVVGDVNNALRGVAVSKGAGGKAVLASGAGGVGARTPGKGFDAAAAAAGTGIGKVAAAGGVARSGIRVSAPQVVRAGNAGPPGRDMPALGTFVRGRQAQLQFCYTESGLLMDPALSGSISVSVSLDPTGVVQEARIANRTWSGPGASAAEGCILGRIRGWTWPASSRDGVETYNFSFVFNK